MKMSEKGILNFTANKKKEPPVVTNQRRDIRAKPGIY